VTSLAHTTRTITGRRPLAASRARSRTAGSTAPWLHDGLRGVALFFGLFSLLNLVGLLRTPGFDANVWWIDLRPLPLPASAVVQGDPIGLWRAILERVRRVRDDIAATLELAVPIAITRDRLILGFEHGSFEDKRADQTDAQTVLTAEARAFFGTPLTVTFEVAARGSKVASVAYLDAAKRKQAIADARAAVEKHDLVQAAIAIFDAELKDVKLPPQED